MSGVAVKDAVLAAQGTSSTHESCPGPETSQDPGELLHSEAAHEHDRLPLHAAGKGWHAELTNVLQHTPVPPPGHTPASSGS